MPDEFNETLIFVKVVEAGSFTAAAMALGLPKTTVSRKVKELEIRLSAQLLQRTTRRIGLTEAGAIYFRQCQPIARALREAEAAVRQLQGEPKGTLRVTASNSVMVNLVAPLLCDFHVLYPDVTFDLVLSHQVRDLVAEEIDVALRMGPLPDSSLTARRLATLPNRIYASDAYLMARGEPEHPDDLRDHVTLATRIAKRTDGFAWAMQSGETLHDYEINPLIVADDPEVLKRPLLDGVGLMMATDMIMKSHIKVGEVRAVLSGWVGRSPDLHAIFPRGHIQPQKLRVFVDFLIRRLDPS